MTLLVTRHSLGYHVYFYHTQLLFFSLPYEGRMAKATDDTNSTRAWIIKKTL